MRKSILFQVAKLKIISLGRIVILTRSKDLGKEILGIGRVVTLRLPNSDTDPIPSHLVPVVVSAIESCASGVLKVGQLILWPRKLVNIAQKRRPSNKNAEIHVHKDQEMQ